MVVSTTIDEKSTIVTRVRTSELRARQDGHRGVLASPHNEGREAEVAGNSCVRWNGMFTGCHWRQLCAYGHSCLRRRPRSGASYSLVGLRDVGQRHECDAWHLPCAASEVSAALFGPSDSTALSTPFGTISASIWPPWCPPHDLRSTPVGVACCLTCARCRFHGQRLAVDFSRDVAMAIVAVSIVGHVSRPRRTYGVSTFCPTVTWRGRESAAAPALLSGA